MKIKLLKKAANLIVPTRAHYNDAGMDCYALEDFTLPAMTSGEKYYIANDPTIEGMSVPMPFVQSVPVMVGLGFGLEIPDGYMATIRPRSSMNKKGVLTQIGTIDSGYRGEIKAVLINLTGEDMHFSRGERICQIVVEPVILADFVEDFTEEARGDGGFGSSGK